MKDNFDQKLASIPKPNLEFNKKEIIYQKLIRLESDDVYKFRRNLSNFGKRMTLTFASLGVIVLIGVLGLSYITQEKVSNPSTLNQAASEEKQEKLTNSQKINEIKKDPDKVVETYIKSIEDKDVKMNYAMFSEPYSTSAYTNVPNPGWADKDAPVLKYVNLVNLTKSSNEASYQFDILEGDKIIGKGSTIYLNKENDQWSIGKIKPATRVN